MDAGPALFYGAGMNEFHNKVVILTGASAGIGHALALRLAASQARLVIAARDAERIEAVASECRALGAEVLAVVSDISLEADCAALVQAALHKFGAIDVLVHNAGFTMWTTFDKLHDLGLLERLVRTNYLGAAWITWHALPELKKARGRIVAVASVAGITGLPTRTGYCASKHAMIGFFDALRVELRDSGVSVTVVAPDFVRSEIHSRAAGADGRPLGINPLADHKIMSADACAAIILEASAKRRRLVFTSLRGRLMRVLRMLAPGLVDSVAAKAIPPLDTDATSRQ